MSTSFLKAVIFVLIIICFSCQRKSLVQKHPEKNTWQANLKEMLPKPMIRAITTDSLEATIPIQLFNVNKNKLTNATFIISRKDSSLHLKSNNKGLVFITLNYKILNENPLIKIQYDSLLAKDIQYKVGGKTIVFKDGKSVNNEVVEYENLFYIEQQGFKLFYTTNHDTAVFALEIFLEILDRLKDFTGKSEISFIYPLLITGESISVIGEPEGVNILPVNLNSWKEKYWYFTHETVENDLINNKNIYEKNPNLRFIGDGLAEFISLKVLEWIDKRFAEEMLESRIFSLKNSTNENFSLYNWDIEDERIEGYSFSLAYWIKIEKENSAEKIKDFILLFSQLLTYQKNEVEQLFIENFENPRDFIIQKDEAIKILKNY